MRSRAGADASCAATRVGRVDTPGAKHDPVPDAPLLEGPAATQHRGFVALLNYIAHDRPDLSFCAKELSQTTARLRIGDEVVIKRAVRY